MVDEAFRKEVAVSRRLELPGRLQSSSSQQANSVTRWATKVAIIEFLVIATSAYLASIIYHQVVYKGVPAPAQYVAASLLLAAFYILICLIDDQYDLLGQKWVQHAIARGTGAVALAFTFFLAFNFLAKGSELYSRGTFLSQLAAVISALAITRTIIAQEIERSARLGRLQGLKLVVVSIGSRPDRSEIADKLCLNANRIFGWYDIDVERGESSENIWPERKLCEIRSECRKLRGDVIVIVFDCVATKNIAELVELFSELPAKIQLLPIGILPLIRSSKINQTGHLRVLEIFSRPSSLVDRFLKRTFDLVVAASAAILLSPLLLFTAIAIKLDSKGPILFRQLRHGFNNDPIYVFKFRTMVNAEETGEFRQTARNDPRITPIGHLLRRTNIDELPQLFNVLRGDMSIVGPRPHAVAHNDMFADTVKLLSRRHNVKPGMTGWAQVNGYRGQTDTHEKMLKRVEYDLYYVDNWSFFFDVKVLFMTVLSRKAYTNAY
jgi:Undecaprenyl-phosphate glucose phosphotransferase